MMALAIKDNLKMIYFMDKERLPIRIEEWLNVNGYKENTHKK